MLSELKDAKFTINKKMSKLIIKADEIKKRIYFLKSSLKGINVNSFEYVKMYSKIKNLEQEFEEIKKSFIIEFQKENQFVLQKKD